MSPRSFDRFMLDVEIGRNLKLSRLSAAEFKAHVAGVLPIAAKAPVRGCLLVGHAPAEPQDVAWQAGVPVSAARSTLRKLRDLGVLYHDEEMECERVHDWEEFNPEPKRDATAAERARRYRERNKDRDENGTGNGASRRDDRDESRDVTRDDRDANAAVTPPEVEGEVEDPPSPQGENGSNVVRFGRKPVPQARLLAAQALLAEFNRQAGTSHRPFTGQGKPSESLRRIIGALTDHPDLTAEEGKRIIAWRMSEPFWTGKPDTGVVFGPNVVSANRESAAAAKRSAERDEFAWIDEQKPLS